jgi:HlyD family secretion protein
MKTLHTLFLLSSSLFLFHAGAAPTKIVSVSAMTAKPTELYTLLTYPARIQPKVNASLLSETEGVVSDIPAPLGKVVRKNQRVMVIKNTDPLYDYAPFQVLAPVSGVVSNMDVTVGSRVSRGQKLASITDPKNILITIEVAASDLSSIQNDLAGELRLPGEEKTFSLKVRGVSPFIDPGTGTATAELIPTAKEKVPALVPGRVGQVSFRTKLHKGFEVPESAVVFKGAETFLRVVEDGKAKYVSVTLGPRRQGQVEILKGVSEGAEIITRAGGFVGEGDPVTVEKAERLGE